jgi:hypothetical protein
MGIGIGIALAGTAAHPAGAARVTYLAGGSVYVDAGHLDGLEHGDTLRVLHGAQSIAGLRVTDLSSHRAACDTFGVTAAIAIGDSVAYHARATGAVPVPLAATSSSAPGAPAPAPGTSIFRRPPLRGRVGVRYLDVQSGGAIGNLRQPGIDMRLDGTNLGGAPLDAAVDVRAYRSTWSGAADSLHLQETRVYSLALDWHDGSGQRRLHVGRQSSGAFSSVSLFDGALAEFTGPRWSAGVFSGTQPEPVALGLSSAIVEFGAYGGLHSAAGATRRWQAELGGVSSQQNGQPNRDFLFFQGLYQDRRMFWSGIQEVDVNRGWRGANEPPLSPTNTFLLGRFQVTPEFSLRAGLDNRRNVRLYRDRLTPETEFDDRYRMGAWGGAGLDVARHLRIDGDYRRHDGSSDRSDTWNGGLELYQLGLVHGLVRARMSRYESASSTSDLLSLALGLDPWVGLHLEGSGGSRDTRDLIAAVEERVRWAGADLDVALGQRWYLVASYERDHSDLETLEQLQAGLSWRF